MQVLAMSSNSTMHSLFLMIILICLHDNLSGPGADELLHFPMACKISFLENLFHVNVSLVGISFKRFTSTYWLWAELKELWRALHKSENIIQGWSLYWIASMARSFLHLTQYMSSQGPFFLTISLILLSKNSCLVLLTIPLKIFQSSRCLDCWYLLRSLLQLSFHYALEHFVMLTFLEFLNQILSILKAIFCTTDSRFSTLEMEYVSMFLREEMISLIKEHSSLLFLIKECFLVCNCSSIMEMSTDIRAWSEVSLQLGWIWWLSNSWELGRKKIRFRTEFKSWTLSANLVGKKTTGLERSIWKESAISNKVLLWEEWCGKAESHRLSLMLKLPVINQKENRILIEERDTQNVLVMKNVISKREAQRRRNTAINISDDSQRVTIAWVRTRKCCPVRVIRDSH